MVPSWISFRSTKWSADWSGSTCARKVARTSLLRRLLGRRSDWSREISSSNSSSPPPFIPTTLSGRPPTTPAKHWDSNERTWTTTIRIRRSISEVVFVRIHLSVFLHFVFNIYVYCIFGVGARKIGKSLFSPFLAFLSPFITKRIDIVIATLIF